MHDEEYALRIWRLIGAGWVFVILVGFVIYVLAPALQHAFGV